ncbi:MAG TPA: hypothetical protein VGV17_15955 [Bosea sp. (in: a-proteobacteria)]|jgi:hypothetical protein|uniref:hypothetical protein n=1 Tax=Bosea sp. (in: a-proteobacteria) TaxID=1871050 RepID=UPI002DDD0FC4|nr:hypothetical protein [Bosea sp. (in: a-proteobacteria)]HEV2555249.1 hypothetical protein [Bosea sp. (in: a-proteobacteria)]
MRGRIEDWLEGAAAPSNASASLAPALPTETHIVSAALAAEQLRQLAEQIRAVIQYSPRDTQTLRRVHDEALDVWCQIDSHYTAYLAVLECKGQG